MKRSILRVGICYARSGGRQFPALCRVPGPRWSSSSREHKWSTPLAKQLAEAITTTGPIPVASYMRQCLTSDLGGYYTSKPVPDRDQFGVKGDFVTSPEISQIFGELIGIWIVAEWIAQGRQRDGVYLMEVGPGRGTLIDDILRTIRNFPDLAKAIQTVYLVEASAALREAQHKLLCGGQPLIENSIGYESVSRYDGGLKIIWAEDLRLVPKQPEQTPFIIAHEFFDALPIHVFQSIAPSNNDENPVQTPTGPVTLKQKNSKENQWRELLVSPKAPHRLKEGEPEFELTMSRTATPHSMYLPEISQRYKSIKQTDGAIVEISPESRAYAREFAIRLGGSYPQPTASRPASSSAGRAVPSTPQEKPLYKPQPSGAALIIDYGPPSTIPSNSLRGIRAHQRLSPFEAPAAVDVSADVDFLGLAEAAIEGSPGVEVHGPVDQARFLTAMGIQNRAAQLMKRAVDRERGGSTVAEKGQFAEMAKRVDSGWKRLVDRSPQGMGRLYQVMAILPYSPPVDGKPRRRPVGFGGDVTL